jgi:hypothetical protein
MVIFPEVIVPLIQVEALLFNSKDLVLEEFPTRMFPEAAFKE